MLSRLARSTLRMRAAAGDSSCGSLGGAAAEACCASSSGGGSSGAAALASSSAAAWHAHASGGSGAAAARRLPAAGAAAGFHSSTMAQSALAAPRSAAAAAWPHNPLLAGGGRRGPLLGWPTAVAAGAAATPAPVPWGAQQARGFQMIPRRIRYRKAFKSLGFNETPVPNSRQLAWGKYGIRAVDHARVPARTIEAVRRVLRRTVGKGAMLWIRMTPNVPVTSKPAEVRMGKGKGAVDYWAAPVRAGQVIFEFDRVSRKVALDAVAAVGPKLPMRVGFLEWT